jgi:hypothetical protein
MKFHKCVLQEMAYRSVDDSYEIISDEIVNHGRWDVTHRQVFKFDGKFYETQFDIGATECQESRPYEYSEDMVECREVFPVQITKTIYKPYQEIQQTQRDNEDDVATKA